MSYLKKADNYMGKILDLIPILLTVFLLVLLSVNIFFRWVPIYSLKWYNEIVELAFAWMVFIGAASLWRKKEHTIVDILLRKLEGKKMHDFLQLFIDFLSLAFVLIFLKYSTELLQKITAVSPILQIPRKFFYLSMPVSGVVMLIYSIRNIFQNILNIKGEN